MDSSASAWDFWEFSRDSPQVAEKNVSAWLRSLESRPPNAWFQRDHATGVQDELCKPGTEDLAYVGVEETHGSDLSDALLAAVSLARCTASSDVYVSEVIEQGGLNVLLRLLRSDEQLVETAAQAISNCSGNMAARPAVKVFSLGDIDIKILEMAYSVAGLGWRVWSTAVLLARRLAAKPQLVRRKRVLELGSGCGLCGLVAAKLGASQVALTDCVPAVLHNLCENIEHLPAQPSEISLESCGSCWGTRGRRCWDFNYEDEDMQASGQNVGNTTLRVRHLEWREDSAATPDTGDLHEEPRLLSEETFDVIIASDVLYQESDILPLVGVLKRRLQPDGECYITHTVRNREVLDKWVLGINAAGLTCETVEIDQDNMAMHVSLQPSTDEASWQSSLRLETATFRGADYYEGGFVALTLRHSA